MNLFKSAAASLGQLPTTLRSKRTHKSLGNPRSRLRRRRLCAESLETRQLLAADFDGVQHNIFDSEDVNDDGVVTALDALVVVNSMHRPQRGDGEMFTDVNDDGRRTPVDVLRVINRLSRDRDGIDRADTPRERDVDNATMPDLPPEVRSIDGTGNNLANPELGSTGETLLRVADADYADGISTPAGEDRPSAREISNTLADVVADEVHSDRGLSAFLFIWGQFIDHDLDLTEPEEDGESFDITVPLSDPLFDPTGTGDAVIPFTRSETDPTTGTSVDNPAEQFNSITSYIDGSQVYGSDQETADSLRTFAGGRLATTDDDLLPLDEDAMVIAGDIRASENIALTAIQTLFVREHNRLADQIAGENPDATDEQIYQRARAIVIGQMQAITYNEFLPALLGKRAIDNYDGYDATVDPSIATEFSTAAFRFGHSTLNDSIEFFDNEGRPVRDEIALKDAFFSPSLLEDTGIDTILKYGASSQSQEIDLEVVDSLRNFLFGPPGAGGLDLVALNIQRGRDHGLSDYNSTRAAYGLNPVESFEEITSDVELQAKLAGLYGDINNIDLWVGLMAEDHLGGSSVGELTSAIIVDQFERVRDGDRFYYENVFDGAELQMIDNTTLADVIERNTDVEGLQENVFFMQAEVRGRVTRQISTDSSDFGAFGGSRAGDRPTGFFGVERVTIELLDDTGEVIDVTTTDRRGNYRFRSFVETGDYQVRMFESGETFDVLISNGSARIRGMDFQVL